MSFFENVLLKKGWRSDRLWTTWLLYREPFRRIPFYFDTKALLKSQYWSREKLEAVTWVRIQNLMLAAERIPFWQETFRRIGLSPKTFSKGNFAKLPTISRTDFRGREIDYVTDVAYAKKMYEDRTSGSTGRPFRFYFDREASLRSFAITERMFRTVLDGNRVQVISMRSGPKLGFSFWRHSLFFVHSGTGIKYRVQDFTEQASKFSKGIALFSFPSFLIEFAKSVDALGLKFLIRAVLATGEGMRPHEKRYIQDVLQTRVFGCYCAKELGSLAHECEKSNMHINEEWVYCEILDDQGKPLPYGKNGRVVATTLDNRVMPLIRYDTGDRGTVSDKACPCGRTLHTISLTGRSVEYIRLDDDHVVPLLEIAPLFDTYWEAVLQYQIVQKAPLFFVVRVVPGPSFESVQTAIRDRLIRALHQKVTIEWEIVAEIPPAASGKAVYFIPYNV